MIRVILGFLLIFPIAAFSAGEQQGNVIGVIDGDTLNVQLSSGENHLVRLAWIDAPASRQDHGSTAAASLQALAGGKSVRLENVIAMSDHWLATARLIMPGSACVGAGCAKGVDLGLEQIARGMAWHDQRRLGQSAQEFLQYQQAEFQAKIRRQGLWSGKNPTPPWNWR